MTWNLASYTARGLCRKACLVTLWAVVCTGGSLYGQDAMHIDEKGNVGIGILNPRSTLDVNGPIRASRIGINRDPIADQSFVLVPQSNDIPFNVTNPASDAHWLTVFEDGHVSMNGGNLGIGTDKPTQKLHVVGTGKVTESLEVGSVVKPTLSLTLGQVLLVNGSTVLYGDMFYPRDWRVWTSDGYFHVSHLEGARWVDSLYLNPQGTGSFLKNQPTIPSDKRLKTDVHPIASALDKVNQLDGISFHWNDAALQYFTRDVERTTSAADGSVQSNQAVWQAERAKRYKELSHTNVGVIAQEIESVLPEAVSTDENGYKQVAYYELIPLLIEALKEEDQIAKKQMESIAQQQEEIRGLTLEIQRTQQGLRELNEIKRKLDMMGTADTRTAASNRDHQSDNAQISLASTSSSGSSEHPQPILDDVQDQH